nr:MAG TPA: hypothetical protein [Caudoviricetes sp.]
MRICRNSMMALQAAQMRPLHRYKSSMRQLLDTIETWPKRWV